MKSRLRGYAQESGLRVVQALAGAVLAYFFVVEAVGLRNADVSDAFDGRVEPSRIAVRSTVLMAPSADAGAGAPPTT